MLWLFPLLMAYFCSKRPCQPGWYAHNGGCYLAIRLEAYSEAQTGLALELRPYDELSKSDLIPGCRIASHVEANLWICQEITTM
jgi:hypothetical protein